MYVCMYEGVTTDFDPYYINPTPQDHWEGVMAFQDDFAHQPTDSGWCTFRSTRKWTRQWSWIELHHPALVVSSGNPT